MASNLWQGTWQGRSPAGDQHRRSREVVRPTGGIMRGKFPTLLGVCWFGLIPFHMKLQSGI